ncbi:N-acetylmuramoyl-L-alanine amidase [Aquimarina sp. 2201CG1-2-11]|uniref:N-acetylmuramoyl-L-alanine amidase n=1 Tax=Aquimarina discodermiae TaxID=3231043 RepID=UPI00346347FD
MNTYNQKINQIVLLAIVLWLGGLLSIEAQTRSRILIPDDRDGGGKDCDFPQRYYRDADGDGYGNTDFYRMSCFPMDGFVLKAPDCDDSNPAVTIAKQWYLDTDNDGHGQFQAVGPASCYPPNDGNTYVTNNRDCDDTDPQIHNDLIWYRDADGDGFGVSYLTKRECLQPMGYVNVAGDCNDNDSSIQQYAWYKDQDGDGLGDPNEIKTGCMQPFGDWVQNADDQCPDNTGESVNNGCPGIEEDVSEPWNTITSTTYGVEGNITSRSKAYYDELSNNVQTQFLDVKTSKVWASESKYDSHGRAAVQTLSAPITNEGYFSYKFDFMRKNNGRNYVRSDFETDPQNPTVVGNQENTLGWYYSEDNTSEPYQDVTEYPFTRAIYSTLNPGTVLKTIGGNKKDRGNGAEWINGFSYTVPAAQEVFYLFGRRHFGVPYVNGLQIDNTQFFKTVAVDTHGQETMVITDGEGNILAAGRSGGTQKYEVVSLIKEQGYVDVHIPNGITNADIQLLGNDNYTIYDLRTEQEVSPSEMNGGHFYRISLSSNPNQLITIASSGVISTNPNAKGIRYKVNYHDFSLNYYDKTGRLTATVQPLGFDEAVLSSMVENANHGMKTTVVYNDLGQVKETTSPDEGTSRFVYRKDGQIRFSQNTLQSENNELSYTNYDSFGRPVESGVYTNVSTFPIPEDTALDPSHCKERNFTMYDESDIAGLHQALQASGIAVSHYQTQHFVFGNVSKTWTLSPATTTTWYSYDIYSRVAWIVQKIEGLGTKTIDYEYDPFTGSVTKVLYQKHNANELFVHQYTYNHANQLVKVETSEDGNTFTEQARYEYYETGKLKRIVLAEGLQGMDYIYNLAGQLKQINHPSREVANDPGGDTNDAFGFAIDYFTGDYNRSNTPTPVTTSTSGTNQYNGNIKATRWSTKGIHTPGSQNGQLYQYDHRNYLNQAAFGNTSNSGVITTGQEYLVSNLTYDRNGNLLSLDRNSATNLGGAMDRLSYNYKVGSNQLTHIDDAVIGNAGTDDIKDQQPDNYIYDSIGQLIQNNDDQIRYTYNVSGLVTSVKAMDDSMMVNFYYNDRGHRVRKEVIQTVSGGNTTTTTFYVLDLKGNVLATYNHFQPVGGNSSTEMANLVEYPIYGGKRIGVHYKQNNQDVYQLTDHLGNVRAVVARSSNEVTDAADYYPGGMRMPGRNLIGDYRYNYQGQEFDKETGKVAFEARLYDQRINRWLTIDPAKEFFSPYLAMGNNWISITDPDGRCTDCPDDPKVGDTFNHEVYGDITYSESGWFSDGHGLILSGEATVTAGIDLVNGASNLVDWYHRIARLERGAWPQDVNNIILHRTTADNYQSTISWWENESENPNAYGTHFLIALDGTIIQTANLNNRTQHTHNGGSAVPPQYQGNVSSYNSVGIEVVGKYQGNGVWDPPTAAQIESTAYLVRKLKHSYDVENNRVLSHIGVQTSKSPNEGVSILNAINAVNGN